MTRTKEESMSNIKREMELIRMRIGDIERNLEKINDYIKELGA